MKDKVVEVKAAGEMKGREDDKHERCVILKWTRYIVFKDVCLF